MNRFKCGSLSLPAPFVRLLETQAFAYYPIVIKLAFPPAAAVFTLKERS